MISCFLSFPGFVLFSPLGKYSTPPLSCPSSVLCLRQASLVSRSLAVSVASFSAVLALSCSLFFLLWKRYTYVLYVTISSALIVHVLCKHVYLFIHDHISWIISATVMKGQSFCLAIIQCLFLLCTFLQHCSIGGIVKEITAWSLFRGRGQP